MTEIKGNILFFRLRREVLSKRRAKMCIYCNKIYPLTNFNKGGSTYVDGMANICKGCAIKKAQKQYYEVKKHRTEYKEVEAKTCNVCKIEQPISEFYKSKSSADGHGFKCIKCTKKWANENSEKNRVSAKQTPLYKTCSKCNEVKANSCFHSSPITKDGKSPHCKKCSRLAGIEYRKKNEEKVRLRKKAEWANRDVEKTRKRKADYVRNRRASDVNFKLRSDLRCRVKLALKNNYKRSSIINYLGADIQTVRDHIERQFKAGMNWQNHGEWHIDHKIPVSWYNLENDACAKAAFHYTNLQPLWGVDNVKKSNKRADV
jgi:hypothetical protein